MSENLPKLKLTSSVSTGFPELDEKIGGLNSGDLIVVAGDKSMGKTTLAVNLAKNMAIQKGVSIEVIGIDRCSNEEDEWIDMLERSAGGPTLADREIGLDHDAKQNLKVARDILSNAEFAFSRAPCSVNQLRSRIIDDRAFSYLKLGLVVIDDLRKIGQLRRRASEKYRVDYIAEVLRELKELANQLNVPVLVLAPLKEPVEQRENVRPTLLDLPEPSVFQELADVVMLMYRDEYYNPDSQDGGLVEIILEKNNHGQTGSCKLVFSGVNATIESLPSTQCAQTS